MRRVFGPVPSRRLGRSLGLDLIPRKTCSYDCTYCQVGSTTELTIERREWSPPGEILDQLRRRVTEGVEADCVTLSGSGEPTLHTGIDEIIAGAQAVASLPVAVLTNGSLLWMPEVRAGIAAADIVAPSLDAGTEATFRRVNRPHPSITFDRVVEGLVALRDALAGRMLLEVMIIAGVTDSEDELGPMREIAARARPDRIQLNTPVRPPAEPEVRAIAPARLREIAESFGPDAEVIAPAERREGHRRAPRAAVIEMLRRRPCTTEGIASGLGITREATRAELARLLDEGAIETAERGEDTYYRPRGA